MARKKKTVGVGVIGCGGRVRGLINILPERGERIRIVALHDPDKRSIKAAREAFNPDARIYKTYQKLLRDPEVEWVMIGSWNCFHREQAVAAFRAGKHVFCEKPLATTLADCVAMRRAHEKAGTMFNIGFTLRYSPHYRKLRQLIADGAIGDLVSMEFNETLDFNHGGYIHGDWRRKTEWAGTHLLEKCCHDVDLTNWMVGSLARRVASFGGCDFFTPENRKAKRRLGKDPKSGRPAYGTWSSPVGVDPFSTDKDIVDNQVAILEYANGVRATFHTNCNCGIPERRMYICGTEGCIRADVIASTIQLKRIGWKTKVKDVSTGSGGGHGGGDQILTRELANSMLKGREPSATLMDGLCSAITCFGMDKAMASGRVVKMESLWKRAGVPMD